MNSPTPPNQATVAQAFSLLWGRIYSPDSSCPDVELGFIEHEMIRILQALGSQQGTAEEQWILAQLLLGPCSISNIQWGWAQHLDPRHPTPNDSEEFAMFYADEQNRVTLAHSAIAKCVDRLVSVGRTQWVGDEGEKLLTLVR